MKLPGRLFGRHRKRGKIPVGASLRTQISSAVHTYYSIRGVKGFLEPRVAMIMRNNYEAFIVPDADRTDNRQSIIATVYLNALESYQQFREIQQDSSLRSTALGEIALGHLSDQIATDLSRQISAGRPNSEAVKDISPNHGAAKLAARRT